MTQPEIALKALRTVQAAFVASILLYAFMAEKVMQRPTSAPAPPLVISITILAIAMIFTAQVLRSRMVAPAKQKLRVQTDDVDALKRWRMGSLLSLVLVESVALYGFALRVLGATRSQTWPFYLASIVIMLIWTPSLDLHSSGSA
jgi:hypothetical protein